mmetsp:Transcript_22861/g.62006  ORF Transcript_22861/g.62006 Transcript_22861/m.62006 type:complete len:208 (-) Transcript_22861:1779-2402(-)
MAPRACIAACLASRSQAPCRWMEHRCSRSQATFFTRPTGRRCGWARARTTRRCASWETRPSRRCAIPKSPRPGSTPLPASSSRAASASSQATWPPAARTLASWCAPPWQAVSRATTGRRRCPRSTRPWGAWWASLCCAHASPRAPTAALRCAASWRGRIRTWASPPWTSPRPCASTRWLSRTTTSASRSTSTSPSSTPWTTVSCTTT